MIKRTFRDCFIITIIAFICTCNCVASGIANIEEKKKLRAVYLGYASPSKLKILDKLSECGINLVLVKFPTLTNKFKLDFQLKLNMIKWSNECKNRDILFMPVINIWHYEKNWFKPSFDLVYNNKTYEKTPCHFNEHFYQYLINDRLVVLAKLSNEILMYGVAIDFEMYSADMTRFPGYCLCDDCFKKYLIYIKKPFISYDKRQKFLSEHAYQTDYENFLKDIVNEMAKNTRENISKINPALLVGGLQLDTKGSFYRGLLKGLSVENKVLIFSEKTYSKGYNSYIDSIQNELSSQNIKAGFIPGIWQRQFSPVNLAEQYYYCAKNSTGYWIYGMDFLIDGKEKELAEQYWQAISIANQELDKYQLNKTYISNLKIRPFLAAPPKKIEITKPDFKALKFVTLDSYKNNSRKDINVYYRGKVKLLFMAKKDDLVEFQLQLKKIGSYKVDSAYAVIVDHKGNIITEELIKIKKERKLSFVADYDGIYSVICDSGSIIWKVTGCSHKFVIDANNNVHLFRPRQTLFLFRNNIKVAPKLRVAVDGPGESVRVEFKDSSGGDLGHFLVEHRKTIILTSLNAKIQNISIDIKRASKIAFEDFRIKPESGFEKYISPFANFYAVSFDGSSMK